MRLIDETLGPNSLDKEKLIDYLAVSSKYKDLVAVQHLVGLLQAIQ
jgi:hypothetical protein